MSGRHYCAVVGCLNQRTIYNKDLSFFSLPKEEDRRKKWIQLIGRDDLLTSSTKPSSHYICALHFEKSMIKNIPQLKADAVPTISLPNGPSTSDSDTNNKNYRDKATQTPTSFSNTKSSCTQTVSSIYKNEVTQTTLALLPDTSRKRKLHCDLNESEQKRGKTQKEFTFNREDEVTKRFLQLLEWQSTLKNKPQGNRYDPKYKLFALNLHFSNPQAYRCLKTFLHLPSDSTLQRFTLAIPPKLEDCILMFLSAKLKSLPKNAKYCTLCIDNIVLKRHLDYDIVKDELIGLQNVNGEITKETASFSCIIMLRGLVVNWKQPVAYSFLASPEHYKKLQDWLDEAILKLSNIGIEIQAIVSDQDSNFDKYAKEVKKVTVEKPYFMFQKRKIYYIFEVPHLINSLRNTLLTNDFIYNGQLITWKYVEELYANQTKKDLKLIPKVSDKHIRPNNSQKMQVKYATEIFSRSVFAAINVLVSNHILPEEALHTAEFMEKINNIFDVLNSSKISCSNKYQNAFSMKQYQVDVLKEAEFMFSNIKAKDKIKGVNNTSRIKTFKNIQITIRAVMMLSEDLQEKGINFLFTRRLNQDSLKLFFGAVRQQAGTNKNPTPIEFQRAFSKLFLTNLLRNSRFTNCEEDICELLQKTDALLDSSSQCNIKKSSGIALKGESDYRINLPERNALTYLSEYLLFKCSKKHKCESFNVQLLEKPSFDKTYSEDLSIHEGLKILIETFKNYIQQLENNFLDNFDTVWMNQPGTSIYEMLNMIDCPSLCSCFPYDYLLKLFTRFRIFSTIQYNNRELRKRRKTTNQFTQYKIFG